MNLYQFLNILWSRKAIGLFALFITVATAVLITLITPKEYVATTSVVIDQYSIDPVTGQSLPVALMTGYMATQIDVITSHTVARKVVDKLKLAENAEIQSDFNKARKMGGIKDWIAESVLKKYLTVRPSRESSLIEIDYYDGDPQFAADVANAFADAYIKTSIELRAQPAKYNSFWYDVQTASFREKLEQAQAVLSNYQQKHGIIVTEDHLGLESSRLSELSRQLMASQAQTGEMESRKSLISSTYKQKGTSESLKEVLDNSLVQHLKSELAKAEANFAEVSKRLNVNHPQYKQAEAQVKSLNQKVQSEIDKVLSSINNGVAGSSRRDMLLNNALSEQKRKVLELKKQYDEIAVYKREVENAQRAYDTVMQNAIKSHLESEISQTNISILNPALPNYNPTKPKTLLNLILSIILGSVFAVGASIVTELLDRRIRTPIDISDALAVPVFAVVSTNTRLAKLK